MNKGSTKRKNESTEKESKSEPSHKRAKGDSDESRKDEDYTLETGHIFFFYRPKVELEEAKDMSDVQRLYVLLKPSGGGKNRLLIIPKKKLPSASTHERFWGHVIKVADEIKDVSSQLEEEQYETKTLGERTVEAARPVGEGVYSIVHHHRSTRLAYVLELPAEIGEVQQAMNIVKEGTYVISVKNPEKGAKSESDLGLSAKYRAEYPRELMERFGDRKWLEVDPPELLDYEGAEILLVATSEDVTQSLGEEGEKLEEEKAEETKQKLSDKTLYKEIGLKEEDETLATPLKEGEWK